MNETTQVTSDTNPQPPPAQPKSFIDLQVNRLNGEIAQRYQLIDYILLHRQAFENCAGAEPCVYLYQIDFDNPAREQILAIIKAFPGVWRKSINQTDQTKMDYVRTIDGEPTLRIWGGELPPCCKLVEVEIDVPAAPARKVKVKRVVCPEPLQEVAP